MQFTSLFKEWGYNTYECMRMQDRNDEVREMQALAIKLCNRIIVIELIMICFTILVKWIEFSWFY